MARISQSPSTQLGSGVATTAAGEVITCHPSEPRLLVFEQNGGGLLRAIETTLTEGHGLTVVEEGATEYLWVADPGCKRQPELGFLSSPSACALRSNSSVVTGAGQVQ